MLGNSPRQEGILSVNPQDFIDNVESDVREQNEVGIEPSKNVPENVKDVSDFNFPYPEGMFPVNKLSSNFKTFKVVNFSMTIGRAPSRSLEVSIRLVRLGKFPIVDGISPRSEHLVKSIEMTLA